MQPSCTEPIPLDTKGKKEGEEGAKGRQKKKKGKRERKIEKKRGKEGGKAEERGEFYKKIGFCKFLLGLYKRILEKKVYICNHYCPDKIQDM